MRLFSSSSGPVSLIKTILLLLVLAGIAIAGRQRLDPPQRSRRRAIASRAANDAQPAQNPPAPQEPRQDPPVPQQQPVEQADLLEVRIRNGVIGLNVLLALRILYDALHCPGSICAYTTVMGLLPSQDYCIFETDSMLHPIMGMGIFHGLFMGCSIVIVTLVFFIASMLHL